MDDAKRMNLNKTLTLTIIFSPSRLKDGSIRSCTLPVHWNNDTSTHALKKTDCCFVKFRGKMF